MAATTYHERAALPRTAPLTWLTAPLAYRWVFAVIVLACSLFLCYRTLSLTQYNGYQDFPIFYGAAQAVRSGEDLYKCPLTWKEQEYTFFHPGKVSPCSPYMYVPTFAVLFTPMTYLSLDTARLLWLVFSIGCLLGATALLMATLLPDRVIYRFVGALVSASALSYFGPMRNVLRFGQADPLVLFLLALALFLYTRRRMELSALALVFAILIKPILWPIALLYLLRGQFRAVLYMGVVGLASVLVPSLILGVDTLRDFVTTTLYYTTAGAAVTTQNQSLYALLLRLFSENPFTTPIFESLALVTVLRVVSTAAILAVFVVMIRRGSGDGAVLAALEVSVAIAVALFVSPFVEEIHITYLLIPLTVVCVSAMTRRLSARTLALSVLPLALLAFMSVPHIDRLHHANWAFQTARLGLRDTLITGVYLYSIVLTGILAFWALWLEQRSALH